MPFDIDARVLVDAVVDVPGAPRVSLRFVRELSRSDDDLLRRRVELYQELRQALAQRLGRDEFREYFLPRRFHNRGERGGDGCGGPKPDCELIGASGGANADESNALWGRPSACVEGIDPIHVQQLSALIGTLRAQGLDGDDLGDLEEAVTDFLYGHRDSRELEALLSVLGEGERIHHELARLRGALDVAAQQHMQDSPSQLSRGKRRPDEEPEIDAVVAEVHFTPGEPKPTIVFAKERVSPYSRSHLAVLKQHPAVKKDAALVALISELMQLDDVGGLRRLVVEHLCRIQNSYLLSGSVLDLQPLNQAGLERVLRGLLPCTLSRSNVHRAIKRRGVEVWRRPGKPPEIVALERLCHRDLLGNLVRELARLFPHETDEQRRRRLRAYHNVNITRRQVANHRVSHAPPGHKPPGSVGRGRPRKRAFSSPPN